MRPRALRWRRPNRSFVPVPDSRLLAYDAADPDDSDSGSDSDDDEAGLAPGADVASDDSDSDDDEAGPTLAADDDSDDDEAGLTLGAGVAPDDLDSDSDDDDDDDPLPKLATTSRPSLPSQATAPPAPAVSTSQAAASPSSALPPPAASPSPKASSSPPPPQNLSPPDTVSSMTRSPAHPAPESSLLPYAPVAVTTPVASPSPFLHLSSSLPQPPLAPAFATDLGLSTVSGTLSAATTPPTPDLSAPGGMSPGARAGIAVGSIATAAMLSSLLFCLLRWRKSRRYASDASSSSSSADRAGAPAGARPWTILTRSLWGGRPQTTQSKIIDRMIQAAYDAESGEAHPPPTDEKTAGGFAPPFDPSAGNMQQHVVARRAPGSGGGAGLPDKPFLSRPAASSLSWPFGRRSVASTEPESVASTARLVLDLEGNSPTPPLAASNASLNSPGVSSKVRSWFRRGEESRRAELEERRQRHVEATHARLVGGGRDPRGLDRTLHSQVPRPPAAMSMAAATETTEQTETTESTWTTWGFGGGGQGSRPPKETKEKKWLHWLP